MRKSIIFASIINNYPFFGVGNNRLLIMKVSDLLRDNFVCPIKTLKVKNLRYFSSGCVDISVFNAVDHKEYYCEVIAEHTIIAFFPVSGSMDTCKIVNRAIEVLNFLGYIKHIKN